MTRGTQAAPVVKAEGMGQVVRHTRRHRQLLPGTCTQHGSVKASIHKGMLRPQLVHSPSKA